MLPNSGNSVADFRSETRICDDCDGTGYKRFYNLREMLDYLTEVWPVPNKTRFFDLLHFAREFRKAGVIQCQTCEGEGTVEIWH